MSDTALMALREKLIGAAILHGAGADAEDVAQEAICRFIQWSRTNEARNPTAWMYVTAKHIAYDIHHRREVPLDDRHPSPDEYAAIDGLVDAQRALGADFAWLMRYMTCKEQRNQYTGVAQAVHTGRDRVRALRLRRRLAHAKEESTSS